MMGPGPSLDNFHGGGGGVAELVVCRQNGFFLNDFNFN